MAQNLDQSAAGATASSIYVIGNQSDDLPLEVFYAARDPEFENRYDRCSVQEVSPDNSSSPQSIQWTLFSANTFIRGRSMACGFSFQWPTVAGSLPSSLTPLPAMGVTYWDQIEFKLGTNATNVYTQSTQQHIPFMMKLQSAFKQNLCNELACGMAGAFYTRSFDYASGTFSTGTANNASYIPNSTTRSTTGFFYGSGFYPTKTSAATIIDCYGFQNNTNTNPVLPAATNPYAPRANDYGMFSDPGMQANRACFMGNSATTTASYYLVKLDLISEVFQTPCLMPPVPISLKFNYPYSNAIRPRYINSPFQVVSAAGTTPVAPTDNFSLTQTATGVSTLIGPIPNTANSYVLFENVTLRADMHSAILLAWKNNSAINDVFRSYDWYSQSQITSQSTQINLIQANNFCSYESIIGFRMQYPFTTYPANYTIPIPNKLCPYVWADARIQSIEAKYTDPINLAQIRTLWNNGVSIPTQWSQVAIGNATNRGVLDYQTSWNDAFIDSQWFTTPSFSDTRMQNKLVDYYLNCPQEAVGTYVSAAGAGTTQWGVHAFCPTQGGPAYGSGPHNQFIKFIYNGLDFVDETQDYGTAMGSLRMQLNFYSSPPTPVIFDHLMPYLININYQGSLNVTTSMSIN